jgi:hypothetical protein
MSKKPFDHIENRIREAAESSEPPFDEFAWSKMEVLLDKEKDNRRRYIFWWILLPLLFVGAGSTYLYFKSKPVKEIASLHNQRKFTEIQSAQTKNVIAQLPIPKDELNTSNNEQPLSKTIPSELEYATSLSTGKNREATIFTASLNGKGRRIQQDKKGRSSSKIKGGEVESAAEDATRKDITASVDVLATIENKLNDNSVSIVAKDSIVKTDSLKTLVKQSSDKTKAKELKSGKFKRFYLLAAIGADAGSVKFLSLNNSKITAKYGVGIGYQLTKRLSIQTGFYAGLKKYIAGPADYNAKVGSYWNVVQIVKVDASCLIYDIPLTLRYNFLQKPSTIFYGTAGVSSFIMKREDYNYYYNRYNIYHEASKTYTGNKSLFAVANFSVGMEKRLSANFSILAEPSVSIPIKGVGDGSVKLYSTALQVGLKYYPYRKHK